MTDERADEDLTSAAGRTAWAWSRTLLAMSGVIALLGLRGALLGSPLWEIVAMLAVAAVLLLANTALTRRQWERAAHDMRAGARRTHPISAVALASGTVLLAAASLALLVTGGLPS